ncbi:MULTISPECIES: tyrosine-type recombinase/integrase [unclassified Vibrio]|uniref:tyrosine-type recombinase/integrase n=1 Tax=unclassified Vibrio TaxID=2614977 RepID=UPI0013619904|nr:MULTISPECIES: integrase family protein [unclassified Vibrio]NAW59663.1 integrase arm-type DNA-binding domain-containing protein [Vibrio sp. V36_P2S2PM302]NAX26542.1 integrase arm-type DNA-binding domain-containing protein [Vibrio sp. V38_P2S17PM301]NAX29061.1 integrase arm-type DNA-binding domain-containing protein [Vibrio sp. V37_P2S8PM304]
MLSDSKLRSLHRKPRDKQDVFSDRDGLYIRVSPTGKVAFFIRYRYNGKADQLTIGCYPEMSLKEARDRNIEYRAGLRDGIDPKVKKRTKIAANQEAILFSDLIDRWYELEAKPRKKRADLVYRAIRNHLFDYLGNLPAKDITAHHFFEVFERVKQKSPTQIIPLLANCRQAYKFAIRRRLVVNNPLTDINANLDFNITRKVNSRVLDDNEIRALLAYCDANERNGAMIYLALLYGCRMGELSSAELSHLDEFTNVWTVPPENHKTGRRTKTPLKRPIIESAKPHFDFLASFSANGKNLITSLRTNKAMATSFWVGFPEHVNKWLSKNGHKEIAHWSMHDLRRTMRTNMGALAPWYIREIMLGHKLPGEWSTYDKGYYLDEQREAYIKWAERLEDIRQGKEKVISIQSAI